MPPAPDTPIIIIIACSALRAMRKPPSKFLPPLKINNFKPIVTPLKLSNHTVPPSTKPSSPPAKKATYVRCNLGALLLIFFYVPGTMNVEYFLERVGPVIGVASLVGGYLLSRFSGTEEREVPKFTDFTLLHQHLKKSPDQRADVLLKGRVGKAVDSHCETSYNYKSGVEFEGAAKLVTTATYSEVSKQWREMPSTVENTKPFTLVDGLGGCVQVENAHKAEGFKQLLQCIYYKERSEPGKETREYLLLFGTSLAGYGKATLNEKYFGLSSQITFNPTKLGSSTGGLVLKQMMATAVRLCSVLLIFAGGTLVVLSILHVVTKYQKNKIARDRVLHIQDNSTSKTTPNA